MRFEYDKGTKDQEAGGCRGGTLPVSAWMSHLSAGNNLETCQLD